MTSKQFGTHGIPSQGPRGGPRGGSAGGRGNRGRGNPRGGSQRGPYTGQPPPPYKDIVVPPTRSPPKPQNVHVQKVQNVTHVHFAIVGGQGRPRGTGGGQHGGSARGNFGAQRGRGWSRGPSTAVRGEKSNRGGAQASPGYQRGRGGAPRGATSGQHRGGFSSAPHQRRTIGISELRHEFESPVLWRGRERR